MTTHQLERAAEIAGRVLILSRGQIGYDAPADALGPLELAAHYTQITSMTTAR
jgi:ABC-type multidrug transport system ATPase subunit